MANVTEQSIAENEYNLCIHEDEFVFSKFEGETRWVAYLNNGLSVFQDDDRPNIFPASAWERLGIYCKQTGNYIVGMKLQFRSHNEYMPENAEGYYFVKSAFSGFGMNKTWLFYITGIVLNGVIKSTTWKIPELVVTESEDREIRENDICLIKKGN